jgi:hypothetical protein
VQETEDPHEGRPMDHFKVDLKEKWCDRGKFRALHLPCSHVIGACSHARLAYQEHIDDVYKIATVYALYDNTFPITQDFGLNMQVTLFNLAPIRKKNKERTSKKESH